MSSDRIRTFLVDDEPLARQRMKHLLANYSDLEIVGEFGNGSDCIEATLQDRPDLIFLDIGLPDHNGLEVVSELAAELDSLPSIVFATAYDEHAIAAFELNALDYLLKPVSTERLAKTMDRVRQTVGSQSSATSEDQRLRTWLDSQPKPDATNYLSSVEVKERGTTTFIPVAEIHLFQADGNYIEIHTPRGTSLLRMTMAKLESQLAPQHFIRVSRSAIVAIGAVVSIEKKQRHEFWVNLKTGDRVGASRNLDQLEERIRNL